MQKQGLLPITNSSKLQICYILKTQIMQFFLTPKTPILTDPNTICIKYGELHNYSTYYHFAIG
jgi:hypothetical protein